MKKKIQITSVSIFILMSLMSALFGAGTSTIKGKVTDKLSGEALPGANLIIEGTSLGAATDLDGNYIIRSIPPGTYTLRVSYIGYEEDRTEIRVKLDEDTFQDFQIVPAIIEGEAVVATAQAVGQLAAINQQVTSNTIVNVVSKERIQEFPDANAAESIGRLSGVSIERSGGEASKIVVRGLNARYTIITMDGVTVPATDADSRGVDLSAISQGSLAGIELYKAVTPDLDGDATAGVVNLVTRKAPEIREFSIDVRGGYNKIESDLGQYNIVSRYGGRFFDNMMGVQASLNFENRDRTSELFYQGWTLYETDDPYFELNYGSVSYFPETRKRNGASLVLDFDLPFDGSLKLNNSFNQTNRDRLEFSRTYALSDAVATYNIVDVEQKIKTLNNALQGEFNLYNTKIDMSVSHALSEAETPYRHTLQFTENPARRALVEDDKALFNSSLTEIIPLALNNFRSAFLDRAYFETGKNKDQNLTFELNIEKPFALSKTISGSIKMGAKHRSKARSRTSDGLAGRYWVISPSQYNYYLVDDSTTAPMDLSGTPFDSLIMVGGINMSMMNFLQQDNIESRDVLGDYALNPLIDDELVRQWFELRRDAVNKEGTLREYTEDFSFQQNFYDIDEDVTAAYFMSTFNFWRCFTFIAGVRYEKENNLYNTYYIPNLTGFLIQDVGISDTSSTFTDEHWLPNLHLRIKPLDWLDIRSAVTRTLTRPDFAMRLSRFSINADNKTVLRGNPNLKTTIATNFDLNVSAYHKKYGLLTVGGFYKEMDNVFYWLSNVNILNNSMADTLGLPTDVRNFSGYILTEPRNTSGTKLWGYEVDLQTNLRFLPGLLRNIVLSANFTHIESETVYPRFKVEEDTEVFPPAQTPVFYEETGKLQGQPENFGNLALGYDYKGFSGRLTVFFQADYLTGVSSNPLLDVSQKGFSKWDLSLKQRLTRNLDLFFNVINISDVREGQYYNFTNRDLGDSVYGMVADFGLRYSIF